MTLAPIINWAQRKDKVFLTVDLQDAADVKVGFSNDTDGKAGTVEFAGKANGGKEYAAKLTLYDQIKLEECKYTIQPRGVFIVAQKAESGDHWPRLLKDTKKEPHVKVDWDKWLDQDDEEGGQENFDMSGMDFSQFGGGGMGGMGDMGGGMDMDMDEDDSDDEEAEPSDSKVDDVE